MHIEDRESVIARLLQPEPLPTGFKRRNPKAYRYTPYSRKIMRRLDLYTPPVFDLWIHIEWDRKISKFNERVQKLMIPGDAGQFFNFTPAIVTVDENETICIHMLSGAGPLHSNSIAAGDMSLKLPHQNNRSQSNAYACVL